MQDTLLIHEAGRFLRTVHTSNPANKLIMAAMPQSVTAGTPGAEGGGEGGVPEAKTRPVRSDNVGKVELVMVTTIHPSE